MAENLAHLISTSLGFGVVIALLLLLRQVLDGRFAPTWWRQVWTWLLVVMFLYLPARSFLSAVIPSLIEVDTPQVVVDGAYDRYNAFLWDDEKIVAAGGGGAGGAMTTTEDGNMWYRHYVHYEDAQGQDVTIRDNDYLRSVTVGETTTYTVHWTGVAYLVYAVAAVLLFVGGLVRYRLFRRRCLRWSTSAGPEDLAALEEQKQALSLDREVELYRCSLVHTPLLMGFLHPVILLPEGMPQGSLDTALAHELTHLKSHDTAQLLWASLARAVHWFNPMVWLLVRQLHREMELCCDYNLLKDRDAAGRRAYGQAILDQMTAGDRGLSRLTTGFSGDKKEVFARFKAMMDTAPKRRGRIAMAAALVVVVLAGSLVGCQTGASTPEGDGAWIEGIDLEARTVTYYPLSQGLIADQEALSEWIWGDEGMAVEEPRTVSLGEGAAFFHTYEGEILSIPASTIQFSLSMTQAGALGEVEVDGNEAVRVQLASTAYLDLSAADLDFTGYCGTVYAVGMGGVRLLEDGDTISVDPCTGEGYDSDHTYYTLPLAPDAVIPDADLPFLTGVSSARYPDYWKLTVVNGEVTSLGAAREAEGEILNATGDGAWITSIDLAAGTVSYLPLSPEELADPEAVSAQLSDGMLWDRETTVPLSESVQLLHTYEGEAYVLNPATIRYTVTMSQQGVSGTVVLGNGQATRVQLAVNALLDLSAADLDFTGWCGSLLVSAETGLDFWQSGSEGSWTVTVDPAPFEDVDNEHTVYTLPVTTELAQSWSSAQPLAASGYRLTLVDGTVTGIEALALPGSEAPPTPVLL